MNTIATVSAVAVVGCWGQAALDQCVATDLQAMIALETAAVHSERDMGSCDVKIVSEPLTGAMSVIIQSSTGEALIIPREFFSRLM